MIKKTLLIVSATTMLASLSSVVNAADEMGAIYTKFDYGFGFDQAHKFKQDADLDQSTRYKDDSQNFFDLGVGYYVAPNIRTDISLGYNDGGNIRGTFTGDAASHVTVSGESYKFNTKIKSTIAMMNAYYDITNISDNFIPYFGGGLGLAYTKMDNFVITSTTPADYGSTYTIKGDNKTRFAFHGGAGIAFPISNDIKFNVGYNYMNYGKAYSSNKYKINNGAYATNVDGKLKTKRSLDAHQIMVGLRYTFN